MTEHESRVDEALAAHSAEEAASARSVQTTLTALLQVAHAGRCDSTGSDALLLAYASRDGAWIEVCAIAMAAVAAEALPTAAVVATPRDESRRRPRRGAPRPPR